jgi:uncharacterized protein YndB with AHSA1/START domain
MTETTAQVSRTIPAAPQTVWRTLTTPQTVRRFFFGAEVESDFKVGSPIRFKGEFKGRPYEDHGDILTADPGRRLSFSHFSPLSGAPDTPANYHVVTYDLAVEGDATRVTLTQSNLEGGVKPSDIEHRVEFERNWSAVLEGLSKAVAS